MVKFAVAEVADQTWVYFTADGSVTTEHGQARLFDTREEAQAVVDADVADMRARGFGDDLVERYTPWIEEVTDEAEFRTRKDTW